LTVSELEQLFGPDATVELRSTRPDHVEADLEVVPPPRRTSRWMAPVLIVVFAAASLLGYALLRNSAPVEAASSVRNWVGNTSLGPTEETPIDVDYRPAPLVAKISSSVPAPPPTASEVTAPADAEPTEVPSVEPASPPEVPQTKPEAAVQPKPAAPRAARAKPARPARRAAPAEAPYPAVGREADDRATQELIEREAERLRKESTTAPEPSESGETYPPGYIEAEIK
jgi:outer membrane biosynthesis protein TonB